MARLVSDIDEQLLNRVEAVAAALGADRSLVVERALHHYLLHAAELTQSSPTAPAELVKALDWERVKATLVSSHCPYPSCPHSGDCPVDLCPL
jgi:metal-responsive CopG/Arc/MetJ family transcriptional regulator